MTVFYKFLVSETFNKVKTFVSIFKDVATSYAVHAPASKLKTFHAKKRVESRRTQTWITSVSLYLKDFLAIQ